MKVKNIDNYTTEQLKQAVADGGRFVYFPYTISLAVVTLKRASSIVFIPAGEGTFKHRAGYSAINLVMGWWGIPWGPIYTLGSMFSNMSGGKDVTREIVSQLGLNAHVGYNVPDTGTTGQQTGYNIPGTGNSAAQDSNDTPTYNIPG